eukprot:TRINITY_DN2140_c0_g1_i5.p1 TRINITY_DN2140_c0_g1~~TRINITY_DN2140_c0_g1_i5.p1  ORF type:complete len:1559 (+),score=289.72 TRINITY_DN2140_c0_g1_i5:615-5291(+)
MVMSALGSDPAAAAPEPRKACDVRRAVFETLRIDLDDTDDSGRFEKAMQTISGLNLDSPDPRNWPPELTALIAELNAVGIPGSCKTVSDYLVLRVNQYQRRQSHKQAPLASGGKGAPEVTGRLVSGLQTPRMAEAPMSKQRRSASDVRADIFDALGISLDDKASSGRFECATQIILELNLSSPDRQKGAPQLERLIAELFSTELPTGKTVSSYLIKKVSDAKWKAKYERQRSKQHQLTLSDSDDLSKKKEAKQGPDGLDFYHPAAVASPLVEPEGAPGVRADIGSEEESNKLGCDLNLSRRGAELQRTRFEPRKASDVRRDVFQLLEIDLDDKANPGRFDDATKTISELNLDPQHTQHSSPELAHLLAELISTGLPTGNGCKTVRDYLLKRVKQYRYRHPPPAPDTVLRIGDRVSVNYDREGAWYPGKIAAGPTADGTYRIHYDDGDIEDEPRNMIELESTAAGGRCEHKTLRGTGEQLSMDDETDDENMDGETDEEYMEDATEEQDPETDEQDDETDDETDEQLNASMDHLVDVHPIDPAPELPSEDGVFCVDNVWRVRIDAVWLPEIFVDKASATTQFEVESNGLVELDPTEACKPCYSTWKVVQLRARLKQLKMSTTGTKAELVQKLHSADTPAVVVKQEQPSCPPHHSSHGIDSARSHARSQSELLENDASSMQNSERSGRASGSPSYRSLVDQVLPMGPANELDLAPGGGWKQHDAAQNTLSPVPGLQSHKPPKRTQEQRLSSRDMNHKAVLEIWCRPFFNMDPWLKMISKCDKTRWKTLMKESIKLLHSELQTDQEVRRRLSDVSRESKIRAHDPHRHDHYPAINQAIGNRAEEWTAQLEARIRQAQEQYEEQARNQNKELLHRQALEDKQTALDDKTAENQALREELGRHEHHKEETARKAAEENSVRQTAHDRELQELNAELDELKRAQHSLVHAAPNARVQELESRISELKGLAQKALEEIAENVQLKCAICLLPLLNDVHTLKCQHHFHKDCIGNWLHGPGKGCPICKAPIPHTRANATQKVNCEFAGIQEGVQRVGNTLNQIVREADSEMCLPVAPPQPSLQPRVSAQVVPTRINVGWASSPSNHPHQLEQAQQPAPQPLHHPELQPPWVSARASARRFESSESAQEQHVQAQGFAYEVQQLRQQANQSRREQQRASEMAAQPAKGEQPAQPTGGRAAKRAAERPADDDQFDEDRHDPMSAHSKQGTKRAYGAVSEVNPPKAKLPAQPNGERATKRAAHRPVDDDQIDEDRHTPKSIPSSKQGTKRAHGAEFEAEVKLPKAKQPKSLSLTQTLVDAVEQCLAKHSGWCLASKLMPNVYAQHRGLRDYFRQTYHNVTHMLEALWGQGYLSSVEKDHTGIDLILRARSSPVQKAAVCNTGARIQFRAVDNNAVDAFNAREEPEQPPEVERVSIMDRLGTHDQQDEWEAGRPEPVERLKRAQHVFHAAPPKIADDFAQRYGGIQGIMRTLETVNRPITVFSVHKFVTKESRGQVKVDLNQAQRNGTVQLEGQLGAQLVFLVKGDRPHRCAARTHTAHDPERTVTFQPSYR